MAAPRRVIEIAIEATDLIELEAIARSRTEWACRVQRARILLAYHANPSTYAVGEAIGVTHQTVQRCLDRAVRFGVMSALDDSPRPGKEPTITDAARAWVVSLACQKPKEVGYPHELWTTRLLARHVREAAETAGHPCLTRLAQGTVCKILDQHDVQPHKVRYYLERRDEAFEQKMAEVLWVYREVAILRETEAVQPNVAIISYDEKPGIQTIASTAPDLPPPTSPRKPEPGLPPSQRAALPLCLPRNMVPGSILSKASSPRWRGPCSAAFASHPRKNSRRGSSPTSMTSTENPSSIPGPIRLIRQRDTSRSTETLYWSA